MSGAEGHIKAAADAARELVRWRGVLLRQLRSAHDAGASYETISRGIAVELDHLGLSLPEIAKTGTGASNIRKLLRN